MDLKGTLLTTDIRIYPTVKVVKFLESLVKDKDVPSDILDLVKFKKHNDDFKYSKGENIHLTNNDIQNLNTIKEYLAKTKFPDEIETKVQKDSNSPRKDVEEQSNYDKSCIEKNDESQTEKENKISKLKPEKDSKSTDEKSNTEDVSDFYLTTKHIDWLYTYLQNKREKGNKYIPYLHVLLEGSKILLPENEIIQRNPELEARCVKLRAQQEAREYRKMTKTVDNVRMKYPEDSISYQLKQVNRQLIAIGQFILSIFAGFLFGFRGVEWMVGNLDFGFRLLLGVMCALVIALAEIYFLAKKINEELNAIETVQIGGPAKFANEEHNNGHQYRKSIAIDSSKTKEHDD